MFFGIFREIVLKDYYREILKFFNISTLPTCTNVFMHFIRYPGWIGVCRYQNFEFRIIGSPARTLYLKPITIYGNSRLPAIPLGIKFPFHGGWGPVNEKSCWKKKKSKKVNLDGLQGGLCGFRHRFHTAPVARANFDR